MPIKTVTKGTQTDPGLMHLYSPQNASQETAELDELQHSCPLPHLPTSDDTCPQAGPSESQSGMLHSNSSGDIPVSDSIFALSGVIKVA